MSGVLGLQVQRVIAEHSGISEGVIDRHFESKDQLFFEAVVEPLKKAVDNLVAATAVVDRDEPLTPQRQLETMTDLYRQLTSTLEQVLPLLGVHYPYDVMAVICGCTDGAGPATGLKERLLNQSRAWHAV